ncbi:MAG TPA: hypothetical protein VIM65_23780 [Cyclobacteriaceae bacterium]
MKISHRIIASIIVSLLLIITPAIYGQSLNNNWNNDLKNSLQQFLSCNSSTPGSQACTKFLGESLNTVYKVNDFYSSKSGRYMLPSEIATYLKDNKQWSMIGHSYEQPVLSKAQDLANAKKAVVAVYMSESGVGHVVVITPGKLQSSGSWGLSVPNAASFFVTQPDKSFVDKSLSFAFAKAMMKDVVIYARNY